MKFLKENKLIIFSALIFIASLFTGYTVFSSLFSSAISTEDELVAEKEKEPEDVTKNYLILGVDERDGDNGRSDTILILSMNLAQKHIGLISIPRDSMFAIPQHGEDKINHAYMYGGVKLTKQAIETRFNLKIDNYAIFNFANFKHMIDILGGVEVNVEKNMYYRDPYDGPDGLIIDLQKGNQHLDGEKAMEYVRYRDEEGDIGRVGRQQKFLNAFLDKLTSPEKIFKLPSIAREVFSSIETDMSIGDWLDVISYLRPNQKFEIKSMMLPGHPEMINDISYWIVDDEKAKDELKKLNDFVTNINTDLIIYAPEEIQAKIDKNNSIFKTKKKEPLQWSVIEVEGSDSESHAEQLARMEEARRKMQMQEAEERAMRNRRNYYDTLVHDSSNKNSTPVQYAKGAVTIINTSSDPMKGELAKRRLELNGIEVGVVENTTPQINSTTVFIVSSNDEDLTDAIREMNFRYSVIYKNNTERNTLIVGDDWR